DGATWDSMTTAQSAQYRALVIGDNINSEVQADVAAAEANASVWGAAVNGNVIVHGADAEDHADPSIGNDPGAVQFINRALAFAAAVPIQTGHTSRWPTTTAT